MTHPASKSSACNDPDQDLLLDDYDYSYLIESITDLIDSINPTASTTSPLPPLIPAEEDLIISQLVDSVSGGQDEFSPLEAAPHSTEQPSNLYGPTGASYEGQELNIHPQLVNSLSGGHDGFVPQVEAPHRFEQPHPMLAPPNQDVGQAAPIMYQEPQNVVQADPLYSQPCSQGQYNNGPLMPVGMINGEVVYAFPHFGIPPGFSAPPAFAAPPQTCLQYDSLPVVQLPEGLHPVTDINGVPVYFLGAGSALSTSTSKSRKRKHENGQQDDQPYVKKPPNAFMLFMKEQRQKYVAEMKISGTAQVNKILGEKWKLLSEQEKAKYYQEAQQEKYLHEQQHPEWTARANYGKKRKRDRRRNNR